MFKNLSLLKFGKLRQKMQNPSKRKALDFLSSGGDPVAQTGVQATKRSPKIDKNPLISSLNAKNKTTAIEILDFFGSKRTETRLRGSVKRLRNSLVNTFDIAAILKSVIIGITKQLEDAPGKLKGKSGGGLLGGILGFLKNGILKLIGGLGAKILGILGGIINIIPGLAGFAIPALVLGGISYAVVNEDFRSAVQGLLPGSETDETVDERIEREGGASVAQALRREQQEKRESRNPLQNFISGTLMGENAEYDRQIARAEAAAQTTDASGTIKTPPVRPTTPVLPGIRPKGTGTEGDPVVEGDDREYLLRLMIAEAGGEGELGMAAVGRSVLNRAGLIQGGDVGAGTFMAKSGSIRDVINAENQYQPVSEGKLNRELTADERARAEAALQLAEDRARLNKRLIEAGKSELEAQRIGASTGFRTHGAYYDPSQEVNVTELGGHRFNTAGNRGLKLPTLELVPPPKQPASTESLVEGQNVSADISETAPQEIAREESTDAVPSELGAMIQMVGLLGAGKKQQPAPQPPGSESVINPSAASGGSPSIAFLTPFNPDSMDGYASKLIYNVMDT